MPYQSQDISQPNLPPRSRLYHLAPIGVGTPNVESLTSFVMRVAMAHCVGTGTVIAQEIAPLINKSGAKPIHSAYADSEREQESVYERLAWSLVPVSVCTLHKRPLEERCPYCRRGISLFYSSTTRDKLLEEMRRPLFSLLVSTF